MHFNVFEKQKHFQDKDVWITIKKVPIVWSKAFLNVIWSNYKYLEEPDYHGGGGGGLYEFSFE